MVGNYPTKAPKSTVHHEFGVADDISNVPINAALTKLGYGVPASEAADKPAMSVMNWLGVRVDRAEIARLAVDSDRLIDMHH